jgi:hypothetical protein
MTTIALAVPHAPWITERARMMGELREALDIGPSLEVGEACSKAGLVAYKEFTDRCHWSKWARDSWRWGYDSRADWFVTLQDDVEVAPNFWPALAAMLEAWDGECISLAATHSMGAEVARTGRRSYRTMKVTGWGWAMPRGMLSGLLEYCEEGMIPRFRHEHPKDGEDTFIASFLKGHGIMPKHPVPTIVDHRFCASTNVGFDDHTHRKSTVTWRGYKPEDMASPEWWRTASTDLPPDHWRKCWACLVREPRTTFAATGVALCAQCIVAAVGGTMGVPMKFAP